jgi:hypothetical protein
VDCLVAMQGAEQLSVDVTGSNGQNTEVAGNTRLTLAFHRMAD